MGYYQNHKKEIEEIRILPNENNPSFSNLDEFRYFIEVELKGNDRNGRYFFPGDMMRCKNNTLVLFQYKAQIRAVGVLVSKQKQKIIGPSKEEYAGYYNFDINSLYWLNKPISKDLLHLWDKNFKGFSRAKKIISMSSISNIVDYIENNVELVDELDQLLKDVNKEMESIYLTGEDREAIVKQRIGQGYFRDMLFGRYNNCSIDKCLVHSKFLLCASHIKPWSVCSSAEKVDIENGFLLCPNHDALFDSGYISFDDEGEILISSEMEDVERVYLNIYDGMKVSLTEENRKYLKYHREHIFKA